MGSVNPILDSNDEDGDIFKPERRFSDAFNTVNVRKKIKMYFKFAFKFLGFPNIPETLDTHAHKKLNLQHNCEIKCNCKINYETKNIVFRLNYEIKIPRNSKIVKRTGRLKCRKNFLP